MKQVDRTTQTKANIVQAFVTIVKQKPALQIKVSDITRQANVDRGTFYRYFESKDALIEDCEEELLNTIYLSRQNILHSLKSVQDFKENPGIIAPLLMTIADNLEMMDVLLNRLGNNHFSVKFREFLLDEGMITIDQYSGKTEKIPLKQRELFSTATSSAIIGLISLWSHNPDNYTEKDIEEIIGVMATKGFFGIV
ncbi:TetR/AcrR family transcriptional regulator [Weissella thailandensis]|uniref:TetR/AcrR family transcriptional regulator n=1 Tax=Weissella thailandensis TaxID=89061 RepID=UPI00118ED4B1|nr:TetR/AcrR family transcriptional regulator [Weissella thailandensis]NKY90642.1 TetR family transcriptional regulator [Weissella thailandensis]GEP73954.1 TetR family transcriptional regulator [Weissella thailandensis]